MKKIILALLLLILGIAGNAQRAKVGFSFGLNSSYLTTDSSAMPLKFSKPGGMVSMIFEFENGYKSWFDISPTISQQGALFKSSFYTRDTKTFEVVKRTTLVNNNLFYLNLPFTWKQEWGDIYTKLGFYPGLKLYSESRWKIIDEYSDHIDTVTGVYGSFSQNTRPFDVGINMGFGVQTNLNDQWQLYGGIEYNMGFLAINPKEVRTENKMYNRWFSINLGLLFGKNRYKYHK